MSVPASAKLFDAQATGEHAVRGPQVTLRNISKRFGDNVALDNVSVELSPGQITALLGENGAGKSTLMKVLYGYHQADSGQVMVDGTEVRIRSPRQARDLGIFMVMQTPSLVPELPVYENLLLFDPGQRGLRAMLRPRRFADLPLVARELADSLVPGIDLRRRVYQYDIATIQLLELVKVLMGGPRVLILDEPTATLGEHEQGRLYEVLAAQRAKGMVVVLITHKIRDVRECADRVLVMRKGQLVSERRAGAAERELLTDMMVVHDQDVPVQTRTPGQEEVFAAEGVRGQGWQNFSLSVKAGEMVGVAGISGSGQVELGALLAGFIPADAGMFQFGNRKINARRNRGIFPGVGYIPDVPRENAVAGALSMADNLLVRHLPLLPRIFNLAASHFHMPAHLRERVKTLQVHPPALEMRAGGLSGGNLQKLVVARELGHASRLVIAVYPTMGLDPATQEAVLGGLSRAAAAGQGVILIHEDLEVLSNLCDRVLVVSARRVIGDFPRAALDLHEVLRLMTGGPHAA